jgi:hypothetical protein
MKAAKISPPDTRSSRISIRFDGLGFIMGWMWGQGALEGGQRLWWTSPTVTRGLGDLDWQRGHRRLHCLHRLALIKRDVAGRGS